jgi:hypothetical protein
MLFLQLGPPCLASFVLVPLLVIDTLRLSNRLVGPLVRLRDGLRRLARGEQVSPIHFRTGDFMEELANEFNRVSALAGQKRLDVYEEPEQQEAAAV